MTFQSMTSRLAGIKVGDKVAVVNHHWFRRITAVMVVNRVTKTQVLTHVSDTYAGCKWRIEDGHRFGDKYSSEHIELFTQAHQSEIDAVARMNELTSFVRPFVDKFRDWDVDTMQKVANALGYENKLPGA